MMRNIVTSLNLAAVLALGATAAQAQTNYHSYVASTGDNTKDCSRASPCANFVTAFTKTRTGGEIVCLDKGDFLGFASLDRSMTINCEGPEGLSTGSGGAAHIVVTTTSASDRVILRGLDFDVGKTAGFGNAIDFTGAGTLIVDRVKVTSNAEGFNGIFFRPSGVGRLVVTDSIIASNGGPAGGAGIRIYPSPGGTAQVHLERVNVSGNNFGIAADGSNSSGGINVTIADSLASANDQDGIIAVSSSAPVGMTVKNTRVTNNAIGVRSLGSNVTVRIDGATVIGNGTGLNFGGGGQLLTFGNNNIAANGSNGAFSGSLPLQ